MMWCDTDEESDVRHETLKDTTHGNNGQTYKRTTGTQPRFFLQVRRACATLADVVRYNWDGWKKFTSMTANIIRPRELPTLRGGGGV